MQNSVMDDPKGVEDDVMDGPKVGRFWIRQLWKERARTQLQRTAATRASSETKARDQT